MQRCTVNDLIRDDDSNLVPHDITLRQAAERFLLGDCELLVVRDESGQLAGVVSESSVVRALLNSEDDGIPLSSLVNRHVDSVRSDLALNHVLHLFRSSCHSAIPVVDPEGRLCGLLRRRDVMSYLLSGRIDEAHHQPGTSLIRPVGERSAAADESAERPGTLDAPGPATGSPVSRPHFLRGAAARERLNRLE